MHVVVVRLDLEDLVGELLGRERVEEDTRAAALYDLVTVLGPVGQRRVELERSLLAGLADEPEATVPGEFLDLPDGSVGELEHRSRLTRA